MDKNSREWDFLLKEAKKHLLTKPIETKLFVSEEAFNFFLERKNTPSSEKPKNLEPLSNASSLKNQEKEQTFKLLRENVSSEPSYDFSLIKKIVTSVKPELKIMQDPPLPQETPHCLILGLSGNQEEVKMMLNIQRAIEEHFKKSSLVVTLSETAPEEEFLDFCSRKNFLLCLITQELIEKNPHSKGLFKETQGKLNYFGGLSALSIKSFRGLKEDVLEKRALWNAIKSLMR